MTTDIHSLVGAYALDAVDDIERAAFDRHLRECDTCRTEVDELRETTARLADTTWSVPPPRLRENVLAEVARTRQLPPAAQVTPEARLRTQQPRRRLLAVAAAAVFVAAAGAGTAVYAVQDQRLKDVRAVAEAARQSEARVRAILGASDLVVRDTEMVGNTGRLTVAESQSQNAGVIVLAADAPPPDGRVYQLWQILPTDGPISVGTALKPGQTTTLRIVEGLPAANQVSVTVEPPNGSVKPTFPTKGDVKLA
jgi:anti-sigma-K factor RskA